MGTSIPPLYESGRWTVPLFMTGSVMITLPDPGGITLPDPGAITLPDPSAISLPGPGAITLAEPATIS